MGLRAFKHYPAYKDSGVEWLGQIPAHWSVRKLKHVAGVSFSSVDKHSADEERPVRLCNYVDVYYNDYVTEDLDFMQATASPDEVKSFALRVGDVIVTKDSESWDDIAIAAYVPALLAEVICGYHLALIRPDASRVDGKYVFRALSARGINDQFRVEATGITRYGLGKYSLESGLLPVPPLEEQRAIAALLDRETEKIGALVAKKERLVELLQEKRAAFITEAVTKGLDPAVPMKDSGVEWLGQIPAHWDVKRLRHVIIGGTRNGLYKSSEYFHDDGVPMIQMGEAFASPIIEERANDRVRISDWERRMWGLAEGDLLFARRSLVFEGSGKCSIVGYLPEVHVFESSLIRVRPDRCKVFSRFLFLFLLSKFSRSQILATAKQVTISGIDGQQLANLVVLVPSLREQADLIKEVDRETAKIGALTAKIEEGIERLKEYRTALISAAVTGKIDVRDAVPPA